MANQSIVFGLIILLSVFFIYRIIRAYRKRKLNNSASLLAWAIFFICYLVAVLTFDTLAVKIDAYFGGYPVTTLVRSLLILTTTHLYFTALQRMDDRPRFAGYVLPRLNPVVMVLCVILFLSGAQSRTLDSGELDLLIKAVRDSLMVLWIVSIFIPKTWRLWQQELIRPMRLHRLLSLGFIGMYLLQTASGLGLSLTSLSGSSAVSLFETLDRYSLYGSLLAFLPLLLPYRWLMPLFYPRRLFTLLRLHRLEAYVKRMSNSRPYYSESKLRLSHPDEMELTIYQKVIAILDMYPNINETGREVRERLQALVDSQPKFERLVQQMAEIQR